MSARLLVVTLSNIGDVVMTTPVLETLARHYPGQAIDIVGDARSAELLRAAPYVGDIFLREKRAGLAAQWRLWRMLRRRRYAVAVDLRTPIIPYLVRADRRLVKCRRAAAREHAVLEHHAVLAPLLAADQPPACRLYLAPAAAQAATARLTSLPGSRWLAVAPGANWPGKCWPARAYRSLLEQVTRQFDGAIVLGGQEDAAAARALEEVALPLVDLCGRTDLPLAAAVLARATAFVGNDSGLGHMAAALGVPTVTVFGPGRPARYRPWGPRTRVVLAPERDLARLDAATVAAALSALLAAED